ncbi:MAG: PKD domain-containing protein [Cyclobacteriaceae bacterium]
MKAVIIRIVLVGLLGWLPFPSAMAQCGGIMEPGFAFLTSSRGCAPFTVSIETLYLSSVPGTVYYVDWGDGTPEEAYTQVGPTGVTVMHTYPNSPVDCGYDVLIDASNGCNPRGSVVPIQTQVVVWTNDVISVNPAVFRVCQGFAADVQFTDNSDWNCFPRATRENNAPRWIQWLYGTGAAGIRIPGIRVNGILPGAYPYLDPAPFRNPIYPVLAPGLQSLQINVPVTVPADIGREFQITLKNWNQCNAYDNNILDGNPFNPVSGNLVDGDNPPQQINARIVVVPSPEPDFLTRLGGAGGPVQTVFCVGDNIYFDNETPAIAGASFQYTWQFFDDPTGTGAPLATRTNTNPTFAYPTSGQKLIRLSVRDANAAGNCVATYEGVITISPSLIAQIGLRDWSDNPIAGDFCQNAAPPLTGFQVRFVDVSVGAATPTTQWRWEFYDENNVLIQQVPAGGGFSGAALGPFDQTFTNAGIYRARLVIRDNVTSCETVDEAEVRIFERPVPEFTAAEVCSGSLTHFEATSTLNPLIGETIALSEWDFNYDGVTFNKDPAFDNQMSFDRNMGGAGTYQVALRVTASISGCSAILALPVTVRPLPNAAFTPDVLSGCSELTVNFTNTSIAGQPDAIALYDWQVDAKMGAGFQTVGTEDPAAPGFDNIFSHTFVNTAGANRDFDVRLRVVTVNGCEQISAISTITVFPGTLAGFVSTNYSPFNDNCSPVSVNFSVDAQTQSLNPSDYTWRISDAGGLLSEVSTGTAPAFNSNFVNTTQSIKNFNVTLIATLPSGCFGDSTRMIRVNPVPSSAFQVDTLLFDCEVMQLRWTADQAGLSSYHWSISENSTLTTDVVTANPTLTHTFARPASGTTDINATTALETTNFAGCPSVVSTRAVVVPQRENLSATFTATPLLQTFPNATVTLSNTSNPGPWQYGWDFGDGTVSTQRDPGSHTYAIFGTYVIRLTVSNGACIRSQTQTIVIEPIPPVIDFTFDPPNGCAPLTVNFTNQSQFADPDQFEWKFGEGQAMSNAISPTYTYYQPGKYTVTLSGSNASGVVVQEVKQQIIEVFPTPSAQFDIKPAVVYVPGGTLYTDNQSFNASSFEWDFGDGSTSLDFEPQHTYNSAGDYTIVLTAGNVHGCYDTAARENAVRAIVGGQILVPNAFSPGRGDGSGAAQGDGKNDIFLPLTRAVSNFHMMIFNRWGELLFESRDQSIGWNGYHNGRLCQQDVYVYKITGELATGETFVRVGDVNLIR